MNIGDAAGIMVGAAAVSFTAKTLNKAGKGINKKSRKKRPSNRPKYSVLCNKF